MKRSEINTIYLEAKVSFEEDEAAKIRFISEGSGQ
jgi:hypothetical protein